MRSASRYTRWCYISLILIILAGSVSTAFGRDFSGASFQWDSLPSDDVVARVYYGTQANLNQLATFLDIWEVNHSEGYLVASLSPTSYAQLERAGYTLVIDEEKTAQLHATLEALPGQSTDSIPGYPCYRTVEESYATITSLANTYAHLAELIDIGDSWEKITPDGPTGYELYALRLTNEDFGEINEKPTFFLMAEIHARELVTAETATRFAEHLLANYNHDADITWLLDYYKIYIVPMTNPDGRKHAEAGISWRKNTNITNGCLNDWDGGTDLNRNHSFHWGGASNDPCAETYQGPESISEPETQAIQNFVMGILNDQRGTADTDPAPENTSGLFISLHSYSQLVLWPWGWTDIDSPNHTQLQTLGRRLAYLNDYTPQQANALYPTTGTSDDWAYGELGVAAYTFEMGTVFFQDCASFESTIYPDNLQSLLYAFKAARLPYMDPAGPRILDVTANPSAVAPGEAVTLTATADDDLYNISNGREPTQAIEAARYSIDTPSWVNGAITYPLEAADGHFSASVESLQGVIDTTNLSAGQHVLFIEAMDKDGHWGVPTAVFLNVYGYDLQVIADPDSITTSILGIWIPYALTITNTGDIPDTYALSVVSNWEVSYPLQIGPLGSGGSIQFDIEIFVPPLTPPGEANEAGITFTSQGDPTISETITLYTRTSYLTTYLPILVK
ncbi:MAG TPA: M14 family zinc carboxypeptidase [Anaerolineales bacterium]|nr:M14 family zinc carboxypeptidase [Anaerolineales bacterium]